MPEIRETSFSEFQSALKVGVMEAIQSPINGGVYLFHMLESRDPFHPCDEPDYLQACVRMRYSTLASFDEDGLNLLRQDVWNGVCARFGENIPPDIRDFVMPYSPSNILKHEMEHCAALPQKDQSLIQIDMVFTGDSYVGSSDIYGICWINLDSLPSKQAALVSCAPTSLCEGDIETALRYARASRDTIFFKTVNKIIAGKLKH